MQTSSSRKINWILGNSKNEPKTSDDFDNWLDYENYKGENSNVVNHKSSDDSSHDIIFPHRNVWIGTTNFRIDQPLYRKISSLDGLEICKIPGEYTLVIAAGYMFNEKKVIKNIETVLRADPIKGV